MSKFIPTKEWIENLKIGVDAPNCFNKMSKVVKITYRGISSVNGESYVGVRLYFGEKSTITESYMSNREHIVVN